MNPNKNRIFEIAKNTLKIEADSVANLIDRLDDSFIAAVEKLQNCKGRVILTGIGKSGLIARKLASTLTSTGTPSLYLHPAESSHGDLGIVRREDVVIALSYGGEAVELNYILKYCTRNGIPLIAMTGKPKSTLAQAAQIVLNVHVEKEACPLNLAPTSSSTATLALGDALAMAVLDQKGFKSEDFAQYHPSGSLGVRLQKVEDIMKKNEALPFVKPDSTLKEVLTKMTHQSVRGAAGVVDENENLVGIITDGDIRRLLEKNQTPFSNLAKDIMSASPKTVDVSELADKAMFMMEQFKIQVLIVLDQAASNPKKPVGMLVYQDLQATRK